jgi:hypothetical protein
MTDLLALLDTLLPGDADFPRGSRIARALAAHARFGPALAAIRAALPAGFAALPAADRAARLAAVEQADPATFAAMLTGAYSLYYTDPAVAAVLARLTGQSGAPPQPGGHPLPLFDPAMLAIPAARAPHYRPTPEPRP